MKLIAFAHLTVINTVIDHDSLSNHSLLRSYMNVPNPVDKKLAMSGDSKFHDIRILRGKFDLEINTYTDTEMKGPIPMYNSILRDFDSKSEISSSSFNSAFFEDITKIFEITTRDSFESIKFRTLDQFRSITLRYDKTYPSFGYYVDLPGLASIAFYVTSVDFDSIQPNCLEATDTFRIDLAGIAYIIRFVKCGEVWVELIQRLR